ncbi:P-loop containing nucleoside triphosphate hydrolase protein, partial [Pisolithus tinctorius]
MPNLVVPSCSEIRQRTQEVFGQRPCLWQVQTTQAVLHGNQDVVSISATGSGKTLTFWMPLLFRSQGVQIVIAPLNILGTQNVHSLQKFRIPAIALTGETATHENFKAIEEGQYRVIMTNPETLMKEGGGFESLWKNNSFASRIVSIVWDEAHCISRWGDFRPEYKLAGRLRYFIPSSIPYFVTSATLPTTVLDDIKDILQLRKQTAYIHRSNDRPNIHLSVREIQHPLHSFLDLGFLIPNNPPHGWKPPKFLIFFDNISESLRVTWFNAEMTPEFREEHTIQLAEGDVLFGLCCTDSFGMGIDLPDIKLVIQWQMTRDLCSLWQRLGRGARNPNLQATAVIFVESKFFDRNRLKKAENKEKRALKEAEKKRSAMDVAKNQPVPKKTRTMGFGDGNCSGRPAEPLTTEQAVGLQSETDSAVLETQETMSATERQEKMRLDALRTVAYCKKVMNGGQRVKKGGDELEPAEDDFVNAATRHFRCYRRPVMLYFGSIEHASQHFECDPSKPAGCTCCKIQQPEICCELCSPAFFRYFAHIHISKQLPMLSRSRLKDYSAGTQDMELKNTLHTFRKDATIHKFGLAHLSEFGPSIVMSNDVLQRIVDCAHHQKIKTKGELIKETKWGGAEEYWKEVLALI